MFLLNSCLNLSSVATSLWHALSRSYSINLPNSFSTAHPSALEYSSRLPVSVYGTGSNKRTLEVFLGSRITVTICATEVLQYYQVSSRPADLPTSPLTTPFNDLFRKIADLSLLLLPIEFITSMGLLTHCPSTSPFGYALGPD